mmetsp:Transcript_10241/g.24521  ORF Transcript_10241/g.24521 Transcript_10241/m.24521 type:complete len:843 (-) Transcript_10241:1042-3570(-)
MVTSIIHRNNKTSTGGSSSDSDITTTSMVSGTKRPTLILRRILYSIICSLPLVFSFSSNHPIWSPPSSTETIRLQPERIIMNQHWLHDTYKTRRIRHLPCHETTTRIRTTTTLASTTSKTSYDADWLDQERHPSTQDLPILDVLSDILQSLKDLPNLLLEAPPGAGKTTIVPLALLHELLQQRNDDDSALLPNLIVVEPRRVAVRAAATRMAQLLNEPVGKTVGYAMRGEAKISPTQTRIIVMTDGVLLNRLQQDPELEGVNAVLLDEFHERGVGSDTCLALCREAQKMFRSDLKLVVMSATLLGSSSSTTETEKSDNDDDTSDTASPYANLMTAMRGPSECQVVQSQGRQYPIDIIWGNEMSMKTTMAGSSSPNLMRLPLARLKQDRKELTKLMCHAILQVIPQSRGGDILVFLPGAAEIRNVVRTLKEEQRRRGGGGGSSFLLADWDILPLYGALSKEEQDLAISSSPSSDRRSPKIIVSSPIAEASLTLPQVTCVVDSGLRREPRCDVDTGMPRLVTTVCARASAIQRAGRAGRVQEGTCLRIYTKQEWQSQMAEYAPPEIASTDLSSTLLLLVRWGCASKQEILNDLAFVDAPQDDTLDQATRLLVDLGCLEDTTDDKLVLTETGKAVSEVPTHPRLATMLVRASKDPVLLAGAVVVAFLMDDESGGSTGGNRGGGFNTADLAERIRDLHRQSNTSSLNKKQLLKYASRVMGASGRAAVQSAMDGKTELSDVLSNLGLAVLPGFVDLVAERKGDASYGGSTYLLSLGRSARLEDVQDASLQYLVVLDTSTGDDGKTRIRSYVPIRNDQFHPFAGEKTHGLRFARRKMPIFWIDNTILK